MVIPLKEEALDSSQPNDKASLGFDPELEELQVEVSITKGS